MDAGVFFGGNLVVYTIEIVGGSNFIQVHLSSYVSVVDNTLAVTLSGTRSGVDIRDFDSECQYSCLDLRAWPCNYLYFSGSI